MRGDGVAGSTNELQTSIPSSGFAVRGGTFAPASRVSVGSQSVTCINLWETDPRAACGSNAEPPETKPGTRLPHRTRQHQARRRARTLPKEAPPHLTKVQSRCSSRAALPNKGFPTAEGVVARYVAGVLAMLVVDASTRRGGAIVTACRADGPVRSRSRESEVRKTARDRKWPVCGETAGLWC